VLKKLKLRAVFVTKESIEALEFNSDNLIFRLSPDVPLDWIIPKCVAAVHHGGAYITGATLRAGIPSVVFPILFDQPFWAQKISDLNVGPKEFVFLKKN